MLRLRVFGPPRLAPYQLLVSNLLHMAHHLILINTLCLSLTRSHCLFISIHPPPLHIAVIAVVAATLLSPLPLLLPPHKLSPLPPTPLHHHPFVACCCSRHPLVVVCLGFWSIYLSPWANPDFSKKNTKKRSARQQTMLQSMWLNCWPVCSQKCPSRWWRQKVHQEQSLL